MVRSTVGLSVPLSVSVSSLDLSQKAGKRCLSLLSKVLGLGIPDRHETHCKAKAGHELPIPLQVRWYADTWTVWSWKSNWGKREWRVQRHRNTDRRAWGGGCSLTQRQQKQPPETSMFLGHACELRAGVGALNEEVSLWYTVEQGGKFSLPCSEVSKGE